VGGVSLWELGQVFYCSSVCLMYRDLITSTSSSDVGTTCSVRHTIMRIDCFTSLEMIHMIRVYNYIWLGIDYFSSVNCT
jgi:hypothetical protein